MFPVNHKRDWKPENPAYVQLAKSTDEHYHLNSLPPQIGSKSFDPYFGPFSNSTQIQCYLCPFWSSGLGPTARPAVSEGHAGLPGLPAPGTPLEPLFSIGS